MTLALRSLPSLALGILLLLGGSTRSVGQGESTRADASLLDLRHPKHFLMVYEITGAGDSLAVFAAQGSALGAANDKGGHRVPEVVDARVDRNSRIVITFDREWILANHRRYEGDILVTGQVKNPQGIRNIEIPGYSIIGSETKPASARIRSGHALMSLLEEFLRTWQLLDAQLRAAMARAAPVSTDKGREYRLIHDSIEAVPTDSLERIANEGAFHTRLARLRTIERDTSFQRSVVPHYVPTAMSAIDARRSQLQTALKNFADTANRELVEVLARQVGRDAAVITSIADDLVKRWLPCVTTARDSHPDTLEAKYGVIRNIVGAFEELATFTVEMRDTTKGSALARDFIAALKDTDVLVPQTGAAPGDQIFITVSNGASQPAVHRSLTLRLTVREFGLVRRVSDSFLLIKRLGVSAAANAAAVSDARDSAEATGTPVTAQTPTDPEFSPAPGATLAWTYYGRGRGLISWLQPGFGFNVSFVRFASEIAEFSASNPSDPASHPEVRITESANRIDVAAGFAFSLFDNAVFITRGWNLTSGQPRRYWGLGFSFVRLAR